MLYPFKFQPIYKELIWGGGKINQLLHKKEAPIEKCGESWEISAVEGNVSRVINGSMAGKDLVELIEIYKEKIVGKRIYENFGVGFPLLIKFIDATDALSIQVHPNDEIALSRHNSFGKTEMWYVIDAEENSELIVGFNKAISKEEYTQLLNNADKTKLLAVLNKEKVLKGDTFFLPAGRIHAIGKGILLAEIQQTSNITYRIYDWDRKDSEGIKRELHTELAKDVIDFSVCDEYKIPSRPKLNNEHNIIEDCEYFTLNHLYFNKPIDRDFSHYDTFIIYINLGKKCTLSFDNERISFDKGETILVPASIAKFHLIPLVACNILEIYMKIQSV